MNIKHFPSVFNIAILSLMQKEWEAFGEVSNLTKADFEKLNQADKSVNSLE